MATTMWLLIAVGILLATLVTSRRGGDAVTRGEGLGRVPAYAPVEERVRKEARS